MMLNVPFKEKEQAKALGARWNRVEKTWYVPEGMNLEPFRQWLPASVTSTLATVPAEPGCSLAEYLARLSAAIAGVATQPEWVRVEVSELRERNGAVYLVLVEHTVDGEALRAKVNGVIWSQDRAIVERFCEATGSSLAAGIKLLLKVQARYDTKYGMSLSISDIDPTYTLGDMEAKLRRIEEILRKEDIFDQNRSLLTPNDFTRVLVIAPKAAAGLGDFKRDADQLQKLGLASFKYFEALFQGERAPSEIVSQIRHALSESKQLPANVLVIIRGGGAVSDLHWLNDESLARAVCGASLPVFTGIGHERDKTILDQVANLKFDTPSKVIAHIAGQIIGNARQAQEHYRSICDAALRRLDVIDETSIHLRDQVYTGALHQVEQQNQRGETWHESIRIAVTGRIEKIAQSALHYYESIHQGARQQLINTDQRATRQFVELREVAGQRLASEQYRADTLYRSIGQLAIQNIEIAASETNQIVKSIRERAIMRLDRVSEQAKSLIEITLGLEPDATLKRGYVMVQDIEDHILPSRELAQKETRLILKFRDGTLRVVQDTQNIKE